jgi:hypothetical protein
MASKSKGKRILLRLSQFFPMPVGFLVCVRLIQLLAHQSACLARVRVCVCQNRTCWTQANTPLVIQAVAATFKRTTVVPSTRPSKEESTYTQTLRIPRRP